MEIVEFLVRTKRIHVGIKSPARLDPKLRKFQPFPLSKRMHDLRRTVLHVLYGETDRPLHAVEIIIDTGPGKDHHRSSDPQQRKLRREVDLEHILYGFDSLFSILYRPEKVPVVLGKKKCHI